MKKFTPISMKCAQEDWESIRDRIPKNYIKSVIPDRTTYLVNNWCEKENTIATMHSFSGLGREVYTKFDANIFLNACGIDCDEVVKSGKPTHYQTENNIDIIDFCKMYNLNFNRGNVIKYVARAGKKDDEIKDLEKALDFIQREIKYLKEKNL